MKFIKFCFSSSIMSVFYNKRNFALAVAVYLFIVLVAVATFDSYYRFSSLDCTPEISKTKPRKFTGEDYGDNNSAAELQLKEKSFEHETFQKIGNSPHKHYAISAYYDDNSFLENPRIVIIAGLRANFSLQLYCQYYDDKRRLIYFSEAKLKRIDKDNETWNHPYTPYFIFCHSTGFTASYISITESYLITDYSTITNFLEIKYNNSTERQYKIALCTKPAYDYEKPLQFLEFIEYHKLLGVEKFTFYNQSIGPKTSCLIENYGDLIETVQWPSPYIISKDITTSAQFIAQNDCLYRYKRVSRYLVVLDLDEMIVPSPSGGNTYSEIIENVNNHYSMKNQSVDNVSGYLFSNQFFFVELQAENETMASFATEKSNKAKDILSQLYINSKILKEKKPKDKFRNKYIVVPDLANEVASHTIEDSIRNAKVLRSPADIATMHHYRTCKKSLSFRQSCDREKVVDKSAIRFGPSIARSISELFSKHNFCNIEY